MTHISPRATAELSDRHARAHRRQTMAALRAQLVEIACAVGLVILAATAGYLAHTPTTACADMMQIDFN